MHSWLLTKQVSLNVNVSGFYLESAQWGNILTKFNIHGSVHHKNIPIYIQQDASLHGLLYLETALHVLGGTSTHRQDRIQPYLQRLVFVTPLLLPPR